MHIAQYSAIVAVTRAVGLGEVGGIDAVVVAVVVFVVGTETSIKVGNASLDSGSTLVLILLHSAFLVGYCLASHFLDS